MSVLNEIYEPQSNMNTHNVSTYMDDDLELRELSEFYKSNIKNLKIGQLNINSFKT